MKPFKISFKAPDKGEEAKEIKIPGTSFKFANGLLVDFEYNRRCCAKSIEVVAHHFESIEQWDKEEEISVSNVRPLSMTIEKAPTGGVILKTPSNKEAIMLPTTEFNTSDEAIQNLLMEVYKLAGFEVTKLD